TTIDVICTFLKATEGTVTVDGFTVGKDDVKIRKIIGAVFQDGLLDNILTVEENLYSRGSLYGLKGKSLADAVNNAANLVGVTELLKRPYGKLSGGQRRRCDIARALINTPKILFLDEPTTGLDPQTRKAVWEIIEKLKQNNGMTIFFTTHYMEEAASADFVEIIDNGLIVARGTPNQLKEKYSKDKLLLTPSNYDSLIEKLKEAKIKYKTNVDVISVDISDTMSALPIIENFKNEIDGFEVLKGTMDDVFINITGKEIRQ
ncbi:MAG: ATP-binding cassette domain-containing protein, partial [Clostridia bacterium]|nr:ATP-binding cassette domain-containing protein [Clostridia bacterium]